MHLSTRSVSTEVSKARTADGAGLHIAQVQLEVHDVLCFDVQLLRQQLQQHRMVLLLHAQGQGISR